MSFPSVLLARVFPRFSFSSSCLPQFPLSAVAAGGASSRRSRSSIQRLMYVGFHLQVTLTAILDSGEDTRQDDDDSFTVVALQLVRLHVGAAVREERRVGVGSAPTGPRICRVRQRRQGTGRRRCRDHPLPWVSRSQIGKVALLTG